MGDKQRDNNDFSKPRTISRIIVVLVGWLPWLSQEQTGRKSTCCVVRKRIVVKMRHACGGCSGSLSLFLSRSIYLDRSANFKLNVGDRIDGHDTTLCYYRMCCGPQRWSVVRVCPSPFMQEDALLHFSISLSRALFPVALADVARHGHLYCDFATKTLQKVGMGMKY